MDLGCFERSTKLEEEQKDCYHDVEEKCNVRIVSEGL